MISLELKKKSSLYSLISLLEFFVFFPNRQKITVAQIDSNIAGRLRNKHARFVFFSFVSDGPIVNWINFDFNHCYYYVIT